MNAPPSDEAVAPIRWGKVIDNSRCIGCHACSTACKSENDVPLGVNRTFVKYVDVGTFPDVARNFQVTRCNQCADPPCVASCPTEAMIQRPDGIVDFDKSICIGCKACIAACPYDAIFINPNDHAAEKCNFCAHRVDIGLEPACVVVCPTEAIAIGNLNDPTSKVSRIVNRERVNVRRPEKDTQPKLFYTNAHAATLDPLAAIQPSNGRYVWSERAQGAIGPTLGIHPANSAAAAIVSYDVNHYAPWDWHVSLYTWTKSIAAGAYLIGLILVLTDAVAVGSPVWQWAAPFVAGAFLVLTGVILVEDLGHPERFYLILTHPQWRSWLVRGAFAISAFGAVLAVHALLTISGVIRPQLWLGIAGAPLAILTAVYTAFLFGQSKARDLWQDPLLPAQLLIQALLAGCCVFAVAGLGLSNSAASTLLWLLTAAAAGQLALTASQAMMVHPTAHARYAFAEMTRGRFRSYYWAGVTLIAAAAVLAAVGHVAIQLSVPAAVCGLLGLLAAEHAYVQAGQSVPLA